MKRMLAAALVLSAAACSTANPAPSGPAASASVTSAPAALNPVGVFPFTTSVDGSEVTGSVEVTGQAGAYGGTIRTSITPDIPVTGVVVSGQQMIVSADTPDGPLTINLTFTGDTFTGEWELNGDSGAIQGRRGP
ncbi:MAG TPA: hypothetical protein VEQ60_30675 [Longimicrobium sp.]|nr:hypothetical protein [Longimicrobium sp.]